MMTEVLGFAGGPNVLVLLTEVRSHITPQSNKGCSLPQNMDAPVEQIR